METIQMPPMWRVRQRLYRSPLQDVRAAVRAEFKRLKLSERIRPGMRIAITAGSRGIDRIPEAIAGLTAAVRDAGADPFIVPAMGSHGGATAPGQVAMLASLGITEETVQAPIRATMEVETLGETEEGVPVFMDRYAAAADGILIMNRVKRHSDFSGRHESGILKMVVIGLGKRKQAEAIHIHGIPGLQHHLPQAARIALAKAPILAGFALLEDGDHRLARVVGCPADAIEETDAQLLRLSKRHEPRIPFNDLDILIVDQVGKNFSGTGLDTKVIGRMRIPNAPELRRPNIRILIARELSPETHGNGVGVGLADIVTRRLVEQIDWKATNTNVWTSGFLERAKVGIVAEDDRDALAIAGYLLRDKVPSQLRVAWIPNTLHLGELAVSEALLPDARAIPGMEIIGDAYPLPGCE